MSEEYSTIDVIVAIGGADSAKAAIDIFSRFVSNFHIDTFTSGEVDIANRKRSVFHAMKWPDRWRRYYFQSGMIEHDPVLQALGSMQGPFTWEELRAQRGLSAAGTEALLKIADEGWVDGLVVPFHRKDTHFGLVSLVALRHKISPDEKTLLTAASAILHDRLRHLVPREGFPIPPAGLTVREIECIKLVAEGRSDTLAGEALGIRASTVHEHVERAKFKLDARNRAELASLAVAYGIISL